MSLDVSRWGGYSVAYCLDDRHIDTSRRYLVPRALIGEEVGPGYVVPIAHLHRANGLCLLVLLLAVVQILVYLLRAVQVIRAAVESNETYFSLKRISVSITNLIRKSLRYHTLLDKLVAVYGKDTRMRLYALVHERLSYHRLVHFVVSASSVSNDVQYYVIVKRSSGIR